jgi:23S rRNA (uridine2552-2'-O)-methyltransferase
MARYDPRDRFYKKAREQGLPSRAAFKIEELITRFRLVHEGARVVDLGCAPGGWLAILERSVGKSGRVVGVDLVACRSSGANVTVVRGDIRDSAARIAVIDELGGAADLVTSDLAPKLSGIAARDEARSIELIEAGIEFGTTVLKPGRTMVAKLFMGPAFDQVRGLFETKFARVDIVRTRAGRPGSAELYVVARDFGKRV